MTAVYVVRLSVEYGEVAVLGSVDSRASHFAGIGTSERILAENLASLCIKSIFFHGSVCLTNSYCRRE